MLCYLQDSVQPISSLSLQVYNVIHRPIISNQAAFSVFSVLQVTRANFYDENENTHPKRRSNFFSDRTRHIFAEYSQKSHLKHLLYLKMIFS